MLTAKAANTVARIPSITNQDSCGSEKFNSERLEPTKTRAEALGVMPRIVPIKNVLKETPDAETIKFVTAKGIAGESLIRVMMINVFQKLSFSKALCMAFNFGF